MSVIIYRQFIFSFIGSLSVFCAGSTYMWVSPLIVRFSSTESPVVMSRDQLSWVVSFIELGDLLGNIPIGMLADRYGRKTILILTGPLLAVTWCIVLFTRTVYLLYFTRFFQGFLVGSIFTVLPMYLGEIPDCKVRGKVGILVQAMWYIGILYIFALGHSSYSNLALFNLIPPLVFTVLFAMCPETPHYFLLKGKKEKAMKVETLIHGTVKHETADLIKTTSDWISIFIKPKCRKALIIIHVVAFANVIGVPAVLSYSNQIFSNLEVVSDANSLTVTTGILTLISAFISGGLVDRIGRKPLLLFSTAGSSFFLFVTSLILYSDYWKESLFYSSLAAWSLILYVTVMSLGPGSLTYSLQAELFPSENRATACGLLTLSVAAATFFSLKFYKVIEIAVGIYMNFLIYACICLASTITIYLFVPETKGKTFDEIQELL